MAERGDRSVGRGAIEVICLIVVCSLAAAAIGSATAVPRHLGAAGKRPVVSVRGTATGLYPGVSVPLNLKVRNTGVRQLTVTRIKVRVGSAPGCPSSVLSVRVPKRGKLRLRAHSTARVAYSIMMSPSAPDACQGARIPLRFNARARGA